MNSKYICDLEPSDDPVVEMINELVRQKWTSSSAVILLSDIFDALCTCAEQEYYSGIITIQDSKKLMKSLIPEYAAAGWSVEKSNETFTFRKST